MAAALVYDLEKKVDKLSKQYESMAKDFALSCVVGTNTKQNNKHRINALVFNHKMLVCDEILKMIRSYKDESDT